MAEFIMQETEEMKTFGSVWKRYEPVAVLVRCKDCKNKECEGHGGNIVCDITGFSHPSEWFCADGKQENDA